MGDLDDLEAAQNALNDIKTEQDGILSTQDSLKEAEEK